MPDEEKAPHGQRVIRTMTGNDLESACRILVDQGLCAAEGLPQRISTTMGMANADCLVAEEGDAIVGVTVSVFDGFTSFVSYVAVAPGAERQGTGRQMMDELVRRTKSRGGRNIVVASWLSAVGFYESMEFRMPGSVFLVRDI